MSSRDKTYIKKTAKNIWQLTISTKWVASCICLLMLCIAGFAFSYRQPINASAVLEDQPQFNAPTPSGQTTNLTAFTKTNPQLAATPSIWPVNGEITSKFGWRNAPIEDASEIHQGIDIAVATGTPVVAAADGVVARSGYIGGYGNMVQINHGNGIETIYGHNSQLIVSVGQTIKKGQVIAYAGSTGISTGPHLHYEVRVNGKAVDPLRYLTL